MQGKEFYANGQRIYEYKGDELIYYYKNGNLKARGISVNEMMEGEWMFYRESGQLWQVGNFRKNMKHGRFIRYNKNDRIEYDETFSDNKLVKKS